MAAGINESYSTEVQKGIAESRIRDTDMAKETANQAIYNILTQAGIAMMAQANQNTQGILRLLQ